LFQKIDAGASGLIVTITIDEKTCPGVARFPPKPLHPRLSPSYWLRDVRGANCRWNTRFSGEVQFVLEDLEQPRNVKSIAGPMVKRQVN
jgi:hypothetical protein